MSHSPPSPVPGAPSRAATRTLVFGCAMLCATFGSWVGVRHVGQRAALAAERQARGDEQAKGVPMVVAAVTLSAPKRTVRLPAEIRPKQVTNLYAKVPGYLREMRVDKGDRVNENDVLGVVESPETAQQLEFAQANLRVRDQLVHRLTGLVDKGVVSAQEMDEARAQLRSARAEVARIGALEKYTFLRAPFAGVITARFVDNGALLPAATAGTGSAQPLVELQDMHRVRIWSYLSQSDAAFVRPGDPITVLLRDNLGPPVHATVTRTSGALDARSRTMLVEVELDNDRELFRPGLFCDVEVILTVPTGLQVPSEALLMRGGKSMVVVVAGGVAALKPVHVGSDDGRFVNVYSGVTQGDLVGLHVSDEVEEGTRIRPVPARQSR